MHRSKPARWLWASVLLVAVATVVGGETDTGDEGPSKDVLVKFLNLTTARIYGLREKERSLGRCRFSSEGMSQYYGEWFSGEYSRLEVRVRRTDKDVWKQGRPSHVVQVRKRWSSAPNCHFYVATETEAAEMEDSLLSLGVKPW